MLYCFSSISHSCQRSNNSVFDTYCPKHICGLEFQLATESRSAEEDIVNLDVILQELRDFHQDNSEKLREMKEDINKTNIRIDEAEERIAEAEERVQGVEVAVLELLKVQTRLEMKLTDKVGRSRRNNRKRPPKNAPPRSFVVKFSSHRIKEDIAKTAWQK